MQPRKFPSKRDVNQRPQRTQEARRNNKNHGNRNRFPQPEQPGQRTYADAANSNQPSHRSKRRRNKNNHHPNPQKRLHPQKPPMKRKHQPNERADFHSQPFPRPKPLPKTFEIELFDLDHRYSITDIQNDILAGLDGITGVEVPPSDRDGHRNRGYAFVTFDSEENCGVALYRLEQKTRHRGFGVTSRCKHGPHDTGERRPKFEDRAAPSCPPTPPTTNATVAEGKQRNDAGREGETPEIPPTDVQLPKKTFEKKFTRWTPEEEEKLLELSKVKPFPELEVIFGRPATALTQRLKLMKKRQDAQKNEKKSDAQAS